MSYLTAQDAESETEVMNDQRSRHVGGYFRLKGSNNYVNRYKTITQIKTMVGQRILTIFL